MNNKRTKKTRTCIHNDTYSNNFLKNAKQKTLQLKPTLTKESNDKKTKLDNLSFCFSKQNKRYTRNHPIYKHKNTHTHTHKHKHPNTHASDRNQSKTKINPLDPQETLDVVEASHTKEFAAQIILRQSWNVLDPSMLSLK